MKLGDAIVFMEAHEASLRASDVRANLPAGSSRAKVTSANARWSRAAEGRDRLEKDLPVEFVDAVRKHLTVEPIRGTS